MNNKVKINYNETFGTTHSRDYYRGASFRWSGEWMVGAHYFSDDYNVDFVVHDQVILACAKSHMASLENEPKDFLFNENGDVIGVVSEYWDFVLSGVKGKTPGIKIEDNYWWTCSDITDPVWVNTGVKAKMELSDLTPEEIALLQEPGLEVVTHFINDVITQSLGQDTEKVPSQKLITDELTNRVTKGEMSAAFINAKQTYDLTYQPIGDYATNTRVGQVENALGDAVDRISVNEGNISSLSSGLSDEVSARQTEDATLLGKIQTEITDRQNGDYANAQDIAAINGKIPSAASSSNQLADKDYVHSEISTSSATFRGTYNTLEELQQQTADNNDYGFVVHTDALGNTVYSRYKYNGTSWIWEYDINSTEFTQTQWDAINSGVNSSLVTKLSDLPTNSELTTALNNKVDKVTGKQLSTEDYTTAEKNKLAGIESNAQVNKLEGVKVDGTELTITDKKVNIDLSGKVDVADSETNSDGFVFRQTGDGLDIEAKNARISSIKGKTLVWNQQIIDSITNNNYSFNNGGDMVVSGTPASFNSWEYRVAPFDTIVGHKYYARILANNNSGYFALFNYFSTLSPINTVHSDTGAKIITETASWEICLGYTNVPNGTYKISVILVDLTQMFGAGNEPSTVEEFEALYPDAYYPYNPGTLISNDAEAVETTGANQCVSKPQNIEAGFFPAFDKNIYTRVFGGVPYYFRHDALGVTNWRHYYNAYDLDGNEITTNLFTIVSGSPYYNPYIKTWVDGANSANTAVKMTFAEDCYIYFGYGSGAVAAITPISNTCLNFSNPAINGQYFPYWKRDLQLNITTRKDTNGSTPFADGMKGVGTVHDWCDKVGGEKRMGRLKFNDLTWQHDGTRFTSNAIPQMKVYNIREMSNLICAKYTTYSSGGSIPSQDKIIYNGGTNICVHDSAYTNVNDFLANMGNTEFDFELATPVPFTWAEHLNMDYPVDKLGTERRISPNSDGLSAPFIADITYHEANIKDIEIEGITDYLKREELNDELDKLDTIEEGAQVNKIEHIQINGTEQTISNKTVNLPAYPTSLPASDVYPWAKASTKPSYNFSEIGGTVADSQLPDTISSDITGTAMGLKTEKLTGQEFVYRATPNTIKAKSFTLDRIQGKSLAWNQLATLPTTGSDSRGNVSWQYDSNGLTVTIGSGGADNGNHVALGYGYSGNWIVGHKYLMAISCDFALSNSLKIGNSYYVWKTTNPSIFNCSGTDGQYCFRWENGAPAGTYHIYSSKLVDLTLLYGSEISGMTDAQILAKFESEYPGYHGYSAGKLISNDAKQLETVGRNVWDEDWEVGTINPTTGQNYDSSNRFRSKNYIPIFPETDYYFYAPNWPTGYSLLARFYDANKNYIGPTDYSGNVIYANTVFKTKGNAYYVRFATTDRQGTTYNHDICINLSDTSFNGQYEPYRKSVLPLNLDDFWVKDGQGNQVHITGGLKSAGSVHDEIVGNKYIKRVGSVDLGDLTWNKSGDTSVLGKFWADVSGVIDYKFAAQTPTICDRYLYLGDNSSGMSVLSNKDKQYLFYYSSGGTAREFYLRDTAYASATKEQFTADMSGIKLNYELYTPIEYDLVEPLIYTMKAGTTEARISPNEDGLSAPFCCDMTYSVADYIEYTDRAGTLVKGTSVDLTDITASGELSGNAFKVIAEHIAKLISRIEALENGVGVTDTLSSTSVDSANGYYINGDKTVIIGSGAPTMVPAFAGQFYINTSGPALYYAVNNSATTDWKQA